MTEHRFEHLLRELAPQVLGATLRRYRDFAAAEDAVQEALFSAVTQWPREGVPDNPRAWLTQVASRRMTDWIRSDTARRQRETVAAIETGYAIPALDSESDSGEDDTLILICMCCHEALSTSSAISLTLRAVGGLTTAEIARAFLVPEATMAQRISRAKQTIKESNIAFRMPDGNEQHRRLRAVLHVLYLIFNEGYTASEGQNLQRPDLAIEAIRLTRMVHTKMLEAHKPLVAAPNKRETQRTWPRRASLLCASYLDDAEIAGLLALMLLTDARRAGRSGPKGEIIPLDKQDRSLWDRTLIAEGVELISDALRRGSVGPYQLQAAIAAVHDEAATASDTDWPQILALYTVLKKMADNPMVLLNHAVAAAMVHGPREGLRLIAEIDAAARLRDHHRLHAVRGHLLEITGDSTGAIENYQAAAARTANLPERNYLLIQAARIRGSMQ